MVSQLAEYIKEQMNAGYTLEQVRDFLISQKYNAKTIEYAVNELSSPEDSKKKQKILVLAMIIVALLVLISAIILIIMSGGKKPDIEKPGVISQEDGSKTNPINSNNFQTKPNILGQNSLALHCKNKIMDSNELGIDCGGDCPVCEDFGDDAPQIGPTKPPSSSDPNNYNKPPEQETGLEQLNKIKEEAKKYPDRASSKCNTIRESLKDDCFNSVAEISNKSIYCNGILTVGMRDSCYVNFVIEKDFSVCPKITNPRIRDNCNALRDMGNVTSLVASGRAPDVYSMFINRKEVLREQLNKAVSEELSQI